MDFVNAFIGESDRAMRPLKMDMKDRSCQTNLISFYEEVSKTLDRGVAVDVVYLDFAKAFDTVPHARLMCKVKSTGLESSVCKWIENWLKDRIVERLESVLVRTGIDL